VQHRAPDPADPFEIWLLRRVAKAVEGAEVSADLPTELHAAAVQELAERFRLSVERPNELLATLEAQPHVRRELLLRRFVEAWLVHQREAYEADHHRGEDG
jgi:hypothetical protein